MTHTVYKTLTLGKSAAWYKKELKKKGIQISTYASELLDKIEPTEETIELVKITPKEMGLTGYSTTDQIYAKANELGLELCPADVGPALRLADNTSDWIVVGMQQITGSGGYPHVFDLARRDDGLWLDDSWAKPGDEWGPGYKFVFRLRKSLSTSESSGSLNSSTLGFLERIEKLEAFVNHIKKFNE